MTATPSLAADAVRAAPAIARLVGEVEAVERLVEQQQRGRRTSACAISSRCCSPPESFPIGRVAYAVRSDQLDELVDPRAASPAACG